MSKDKTIKTISIEMVLGLIIMKKLDKKLNTIILNHLL